jgi:chromosome segregation ATPase
MSLLKKNVTISAQHPDPRSTAAQFMEEHDYLQRQVVLIEDENKSLKQDVHNLTAEVQMLRDEIERADSERLRLQAFSVGIATRLTVIKETIDGAMREAALHRIEPKQDETVDAAQKEVAEAKEIVSRLGKMAVADELRIAIGEVPKNQHS